MKKIVKLALSAVCVSLVVSCAKNDLGESNVTGETGEGVVELFVGDDATGSKAAAGAERITRSVVADLSEQTGIQGLVLEETVTSLDDNAMLTKGTPVYTENFLDVYGAGFGAIKVVSEGKDLTDFYPATFKKRENSDRWYYRYASDLPGKSLFYFRAPAVAPDYISGESCADGAVTFSLIPAKYPTTAVDQKDILFAASEVEPGKAAKVKFFHAFAQVKFKQGGTDNSIKITKIEISNLLTSGTCTVTPDASKKSYAVSAWTQTEKSYATFSQTYDGTISYKESEGYFGASFYNDATDENNLNIGGDKKATTTFMCVPQSFSSDDANPVVATVTYTRNGETKTVKTNFSTGLNGKSWEPGKLYTYTLTITDLGLSIEDNVTTGTGSVFSNLVVTNTGNRNGYIRGALVANWVIDIDGEPVILRSWDINNPEEIEWIEWHDVTKWNWVLDETTGYFYYKYGVKPGNTTKQVCAFKVKGAPQTGAYVELDIVGQIVADRSVWGTIPSGLSDDIEE